MYILVNLFNFLFHYNPLLISSSFPTLVTAAAAAAAAGAIVICLFCPFNVASGYTTPPSVCMPVYYSVRFSLEPPAKKKILHGSPSDVDAFESLFGDGSFKCLFIYVVYKLNKVGV